MMPDADAEMLSLNPSLVLRVEWEVRRKDRGRTRFTMRFPDDVPLVQWLLGTLQAAHAGEGGEREVELSSDILDAAIEKGLLVAEDALPGEESSFACRLDPALLALVPEEDMIALRTACEETGIVLNPACCIQETDDPPQDERVRLGAALWDHLGGDFAQEGRLETTARRGLPPLETSYRLWVPHPFTEAMQPVDMDRSSSDELRAGSIDCEKLAAATRDMLLATHVLIPRPTDESRARDADRIERLRDGLKTDGYVVVRNVLSPLQVAAMRRHFRTLHASGNFTSYEVPSLGARDGIYCDFVSVLFQDQLTRFIGKVVDEPIKPSFTWHFHYRDRAVLTRHIDRPQCRWNVSLAVDSNADASRAGAWSLHFETDQGAHSVRLGPGDAVVYSGTDTPHWREPLPEGHTAGVICLHYVSANFDGSLR
ncbi:hypothetical protein LVJ94_34475 [Pendulispora rubella]|uniref:Uncharacterized protein n=1 Tax=Pendulispora rubella TaxID=2741070 RepID=A0ABZ2KYC1_9BACT